MYTKIVNMDVKTSKTHTNGKNSDIITHRCVYRWPRRPRHLEIEDKRSSLRKLEHNNLFFKMKFCIFLEILNVIPSLPPPPPKNLWARH